METQKEVLHREFLKYIRGMESIHTKSFPVAYEKAALNAMTEWERINSQTRMPRLPNETIVQDEDITQAGYITDELLPCPFCGGKPLTHGEQNPGTRNIVYKVSCHNTDCWASVFTCVSEEKGAKAARDMVVAAWNRRTI